MWSEIVVNGVNTDNWKFAIAEFLKPIKNIVDESPANLLLNISTLAAKGIDPLQDGNNLAILEEMKDMAPSLNDVEKWCQRFNKNPLSILVMRTDPSLLSKWDKQEAQHVEECVVNGAQPQNKIIKLGDRSIDQLPCLDERDLIVPEQHIIPRTSILSHKDGCAITHLSTPKSSLSSIQILWDLAQENLSNYEKMIFELWTVTSKNMGTKDRLADEQEGWEGQRGVSIDWYIQRGTNRQGDVGLWLSCKSSSLSENISHAAEALIDRSSANPQLEEVRWRTIFTNMRDLWKKQDVELSTQRSKLCALSPYSNIHAANFESFDFNLKNRMSWINKAIANPSFALVA